VQIPGSKILVTGGCGLIGSTTIDLLLREYDPAQIVILDNLVRGSLHNVQEMLDDPRVTLVEGDIRDVPTVHKVTEGMDAVIHMATLRITACAAEPREALEVMCDGSYNVLEAAKDWGEEVRHRFLGFGLRPGGHLPDQGRPPPLQQPHLVRREQGDARGPAAVVQ